MPRLVAVRRRFPSGHRAHHLASARPHRASSLRATWRLPAEAASRLDSGSRSPSVPPGAAVRGRIRVRVRRVPGTPPTRSSPARTSATSPEVTRTSTGGTAAGDSGISSDFGRSHRGRPLFYYRRVSDTLHGIISSCQFLKPYKKHTISQKNL